MRCILFSLILFVLTPEGLRAQPCASQAAFAAHLTEERDWYRAVTENLRLAWSCPSSTTASNLDLVIGRIHLQAGNNGLARSHFYSWMAERRAPERLLIGRALLCQSYEKDGDFANAYYSLEQMKGRNEEEAMRLALKRSELSLKLLDERGNRKTAPSLLPDIPPSHQTLFSNELRLLRMKEKESLRLPYKSPFLTALFGVIPGMNLVYCGRTKQGLINLAAHAGLSGLLAWTISTERWPATLLLGSTAISWYMYNFTAGNEALQDYNEGVRRRFRLSFSLPFNP